MILLLFCSLHVVTAGEVCGDVTRGARRGCVLPRVRKRQVFRVTAQGSRAAVRLWRASGWAGEARRLGCVGCCCARLVPRAHCVAARGSRRCEAA